MTPEENTSIAPRASRAFRILKTGDVEIFPGAGSVLHFANRDVDTLRLEALPAGLLARGDSVRVEYSASGKWVTVFAGDVDRIVDAHGRGDERVQTVTVAGPWGRMNRLVFRQTWEPGPSVSISSSRVVLGQTSTGFRQTMAEQLGEILEFARSRCGFSVGRVDALGLYLPLDETRDITCADAVRRELRFFPKRIVRFDYSKSSPEIQIVEPGTDDAAYVAGVPKTRRVYEYTAHPVSCVDVAVDAADVVIGGTNLTGHQVYPPNADTDDLDCLHVTVQLSPGSSSSSYESFRSVTEKIPEDLTSAEWWKEKHPRLANVLEREITITDAARSPNTYDRIAKSTKGEIEAAGLHCEVSRFSCTCHIRTSEDEEEDIRLTMDFLTTNAETKTYTWQTGSTSVAGETLPEGLAEALYEQRAQELVNERMTVRLGETFPVLGDAADGLYLQSFDVSLDDLTAELSFGQPEHLSAEDMRSLLNGFRQRGYSSTARLRAGSEGGGEEDEDAPGGIPPISASDWAPGTKAKTTIAKSTGGASLQSASPSGRAAGGPAIFLDASGGGGRFNLDTSDLEGNETIGVHTLTYNPPEGKGEQKTYKILADQDVTIDGGGSGGGKAVKDISFAFDDESGQLKATLKFSSGSDEDGEGSSSDKTVDLPIWKYDVVSSMSYSDKKFKYKTSPSVATTDPSELDPTEAKDPVFEAVQHLPEQ